MEENAYLCNKKQKTMRNLVRQIGLTILLVVAIGKTQAAVFRPVVTNYTTNDYGQEASQQNWDCSKDDNGYVYIANNNCLLRFDGYSWKRIALNGKAMIRSVHASGNRIYVGAFEEFGYFSRNELGEYIYSSLANSNKEGSHVSLLNNEEPWVILENEGRIYFQTFSSIYIYDGQGVQKLELNDKQPLFIFKAGNDIYMQAIKGDFYRIDGMRLTRLFSRETVGDDDIVGIFPLYGSEHGIVMASIRHGLFVYNQGEITKMPTKIDTALSKMQVNKACSTRSGIIVLGTIQSGIWGISSQGDLLWHFNTENGLTDNAVLRLLCDKADNVWACLDEGISQIACGKPYKNLTVNSQMSSVGMVYDLHISGDNMLMATNQGIYECNISQASSLPQLVMGTEGQNWHLTDINGELFAGNNSRTLRIKNGQVERIQKAENGSTCLRQVYWHGEPVLIESTYNRLYVYRKKDNVWQQPEAIENFNHPIRQIEMDNDGSLWASNMQKGVYHLWLSDDLKQVTDIKHYNKLDSVDTRCFVTRFNDRIVLADDDRLYVFDRETNKIVPYHALNDLLPSTSGITNIIAVNGKEWWVCSQKYYMLVAKADDGYRLKKCISSKQLGMFGNDCNALAYLKGDKVYFNMAHGVACMDTASNYSENYFPLYLDYACFKDKRDTYHALSISDVTEGKAQVDGNILMQFSCPNFGHEIMKYRFTIHGKENHVVESEEPRLVLPNISFGQYHIKVEAIGLDGKVHSTLDAGFVVPRPWFITWWAFLIYIIVILLCCWAIAQWNARRQLARQHLKMMEQERIIAEQRHQLLQQELSEKSKNLAAMSLDVAVKQNVIESLRDSIIEQKKKGNISRNDMRAQLQRIQQTSSDKEFWDIFQQNFDLIHEHFFRNLKEQYPSLTANDLKFCALLRLNLSTKEIANFTNLSIRGVESARLRLRHKFQLSTEQNLVEYLIAFK